MRHPAVLVDAGYWVALARADDALHGRAVAWQRLVDARRTRLVTVDWTFVELFRVLASPRLRTPRTQAIRVLEAIRAEPALRVVHVEPRVRDAAWAALAAQPQRTWSWTDAAAFELMRAEGLTQVLGHDRHFIEAGFDALLRSEPTAYA